MEKRKKINLIADVEFSRIIMLLNNEENLKPILGGIYQDWLKNAFSLALLTGMRSDELFYLRWSKIRISKKGGMEYLVFRSCKTGRSNLVLITKELKGFLKTIGYNKLKRSDEYIIAPNSVNRLNVKRKTITAFKYLYELISPSEQIAFKCLRVTYLSRLYSSFLTYHKD